MSSTRSVRDRNRFLQDHSLIGMVTAVCKEVLRRKYHPGDLYKPDNNPEADQLGFHRSMARTRLLFGGNQSGKSRATAQEVKWWLEGSHPYRTTPEKPKIYVVSADYRTLAEGVYRHLLGDPGEKCPAILKEWELVRRGTSLPGAASSIPAWILHKNGGVVNFISGEGGEKARKKVQAAAVDLICIDEEIPSDMWKELMARRLSYGGEVIVSATLVRSEDWLIDLEDKAVSGDPQTHLTRLDTRRAVARGHVDKQAYEEMESLLSDEEQHVRLRGGSRVRQGLVYPEFGAKHVVDPHDLGDNWTRYCSIDPGRRTCAILWGAVDPDGRIYIYREGYFHGKTYHDLARFIYGVEKWVQIPDSEQYALGQGSEIIQTRWIDPHAFDHAVSGQPGVGTLLSADYRITTSPAPNAVHYGIEKVHQQLRVDMTLTPGLVIFRSCPNLIREFKSYKWVDDQGSSRSHERADGPVKRNDHALDALRYMIAGGCKFDRTNKKWVKLKEKLERERDIGAFASTKLQDRMRDWWSRREAERHGYRPGGGFVGGVGDDGR